jgi:hypothetical protein
MAKVHDKSRTSTDFIGIADLRKQSGKPKRNRLTRHATHPAATVRSTSRFSLSNMGLAYGTGADIPGLT